MRNKPILYIINFLIFPLALLLLSVKYLFGIVFFRVHGNRIGHLAMNTEFFLREQQMLRAKGKITRELTYLGIAPNVVCNQALMEMWKRKMKILQFWQPLFFRTITKYLAQRSILGRWGLFIIFPQEVRYFQEFNNFMPNLIFSDAEVAKGNELLENMGIKDWYICFHARDSVYVSSLLKRGDARYANRNSNIEFHLKAAEYITRKGGYALRMGAKTQNKITVTDNFQIIDYANKFRTELGDIYLTANCKFFLGVPSGIESVAEIFNVPLILTNFIPLTPLMACSSVHYFPPGKNDLFIPKKIWSGKKKRLLTFKEIIEFDLKIFSFEAEDYEKAELVPIENTAEEILAVTIEMNERLDGLWKGTEEDEELQRRFKALFVHKGKPYEFSARIGTQFLRENKNLLD